MFKVFINYTKNPSKYKILYFFWFKTTFIYSKLCCFLENIFLKKNFIDNEFNNLGFFTKENKENKNFNKIISDNSYIKKVSDISNIYIIRKKNINNFINLIFDKKLRDYITSITGFEYSLDWFIVYENLHLEKGKKSSRMYHFDKPFSNNMLKIFIPLNVEGDCGALKVYDQISSKRIKYSQKSNKNLNHIYLTGKGDFIYGVKPNICWHKERNPKSFKSCKQMMFQFNPSSNWKYRNDLFDGQITGERKFTSFRSLINDRKYIDFCNENNNN